MAAGSDPVRIGWMRARSGGMEDYDGSAALGGQLAVDDANRAGGALGRPLEIVYGDYETDLDKVEPTARDLLDQGVDVLHLACDCDFAVAAARLANERGVLNLGVAGDTTLGLAQGDLTFNTWHGNPTEAGVMAEFVIGRGWRRPFVVRDTVFPSYCSVVADLFEASFRQLAADGAIAGRAMIANDDSSFPEQVAAVAAADADVVVICSFVPGGAVLIRELREAGVALPIVGSGGGFDSAAWLELVPEPGDVFAAGVLATPAGVLSETESQLVDRARVRGDGAEPATGHVLVGYATMQGLVRAIERAGSTDATALRTAFESFRDEDLVVGPTTFTAESHVALGRPLAVVDFTDGEHRHHAMIRPSVVIDPELAPPSEV